MSAIDTHKEELLARVEASLDTMRPYLQKDGGNVEVVEIDDNQTLWVRLVGACETCPQSFMTMKAGIEEAVKGAVPEIVAVKSIATK
jgi:Fe-S cluster biogenesis protein NfuA